MLQLSKSGSIYMCGEGDSGIYLSDLSGERTHAGGAWVHIPAIAPLHALQQPALKMGSMRMSTAALSCMVLSRDGALLLTGDVTGQVVVRAARCLTVLSFSLCLHLCAWCVGCSVWLLS